MEFPSKLLFKFQNFDKLVSLKTMEKYVIFLKQSSIFDLSKLHKYKNINLNIH